MKEVNWYFILYYSILYLNEMMFNGVVCGYFCLELKDLFGKKVVMGFVGKYMDLIFDCNCICI